MHSFATPDGTQKIEDTGPLTKKRMETIDTDIAARSAEFLEKHVGYPCLKLQDVFDDAVGELAFRGGV
jgi:hypothetical protein